MAAIKSIINRAARRGSRIVVVIGRKLPDAPAQQKRGKK